MFVKGTNGCPLAFIICYACMRAHADTYGLYFVINIACVIMERNICEFYCPLTIHSYIHVNRAYTWTTVITPAYCQSSTGLV